MRDDRRRLARPAPLYVWEYAATGPFALSGGNLMIIAYVVLGQAVIAFFCWMQGVRIVGANRAAVVYDPAPSSPPRSR